MAMYLLLGKKRKMKRKKMKMLISGAPQILVVLEAKGAREPRTMKCTKAIARISNQYLEKC